jgi:hypothetical protein
LLTVHLLTGLKKVKEESEVQQKAIEEASPLERESKEEGNMTS